MARLLVGWVLLVSWVCLPAMARGPAYIVIEADSGAVLADEHADAPWYPASLTKVMTLYLTFSALQKGDLTLSTALPVSATAARQPAVHLGVQAGKTISVQEAIHALAILSANDVAVVLAEALGGDEAGFVRQMNQAAKRLQMYDSHFVNASGLPDRAQTTSARDMALLARALINQFPNYYHFFAAKSFQYQGTRYVSRNRFVQRYPGAEGLKTGYTCGSGYNLVAAASQQGVRLIAVLLGSESTHARQHQITALLNQGFIQARQSSGKPLITLRRSLPLDQQAEALSEAAHCLPL